MVEVPPQTFTALTVLISQHLTSSLEEEVTERGRLFSLPTKQQAW
jgi:hypothetical protein